MTAPVETAVGALDVGGTTIKGAMIAADGTVTGRFTRPDDPAG